MTTGVAQEVPINEQDDVGDPFGGNLQPTTAGPKPRTVWNTRTHEALVLNGWNVPEALKKKHKDPAYPEWIGRKLFSLEKTGERVLGSFKCLLHPAQPWAAQYAARGFSACPSAHLASEAEQRLHMRAKHRAEWARIEDDRKEQERQEDRKLMREQVDAMLAIAQGNGRSAAVTPPRRGGRPKRITSAEEQSTPAS